MDGANTELTTALEIVLDRSPQDAAEILGQALRQAAADPVAASGLDPAIITGLVNHRKVDDVLALLDLKHLAPLVKRCCTRLESAGKAPALHLREQGWALLDILRRSSLLRRRPREKTGCWADNILALVEQSDFTVGPLFRQRVATYGSKVLFRIHEQGEVRALHWRQVALRVEAIARGLVELHPDHDPGPVAILSENRLEMALVDLACLTSGIYNVMIPANSTPEDVGFILDHSGVETVVVSGTRQLAKLAGAREAHATLKHVVLMDSTADQARDLLTLDMLSARGNRVPAAEIRERSLAVSIDDLATTMYTSGTTGKPKGIQFTQRNIVFKRFARALALPEIGDEDVFVCYLPLFHTFGRFLEMLGAVFWGATYNFVLNPSVETLMRVMQSTLPTVFISVPKKWIQLHDAIMQQVDPITAGDDELKAAIRAVTGGRLRWGLSAAGHLNSEIFRFFQSQGVELMSGFGMTEATGGITMTAPKEYKDDSLGTPLPGIEIRLAADGELLIRGPYVMAGYLNPPEGEAEIDSEGWFPSGDLMEMDRDGYIRLVDRKKEIYKNIKGETIAPQRVENPFRDFESVGRVFLVGDHREYNTALIWPNPEYAAKELAGLDIGEVKAHFRSVVISVNKFLAPFERIVDFAIIDRDLDPEKGELTPKGTPRRRTVEANFAEVIKRLYRRTILHVGGQDIIVPNWLFQALGLVAQDLVIRDNRISLPSSDRMLTVERIEDGLTRVGSCIYRHRPGPLEIGSLLTVTALWLGNGEMVDFIGLDLAPFERPGRIREGLSWQGYSDDLDAPPQIGERLSELINLDSPDMADLHIAAIAISAGSSHDGLTAIDFLNKTVTGQDGILADPARLLLARAAYSGHEAVRKRSFQVLAPVEKDAAFPETLGIYLTHAGDVLDAETRESVCEGTLSSAKLRAFFAAATELCEADSIAPGNQDLTRRILRLLSDYGTFHPTSYSEVRAFLAREMMFAVSEDVRNYAGDAFQHLVDGFRQWLGPPSRIAVDPETGQEYRWADVVVFDDMVPENDRLRMLSALQKTPFLREAVFLFSKGVTIRLNDIPPGGVFIRLLGSNHGKSVYRATVQTRFKGSFDLAVNINHDLTQEEVREEIFWLILCGESPQLPALAEEFGGYWQAQDLWSEEFIAGETLDRAMRRLSRRGAGGERLENIWPFLAWTTLNAYVDFWHRTGTRWEISDPEMPNVVASTHDYQTSARLVSVTRRQRHRGLGPMLIRLMDRLLLGVEDTYPRLKGLVGWHTVLSSVLEVLGEAEGLTALKELAGNPIREDLDEALPRFLEEVEQDGFTPLKVFFAIERYRRWAELSSDPTPEARARTLRELFETYGLAAVVGNQPETRVRFFRKTVFQSGGQLETGLREIEARLRNRAIPPDDVADSIADLRGNKELSDDEDYFLARLSFPHLRPEDAATFVEADFGGRQTSEVVVKQEDREGNPFRIRHALNPREVGRLHRLFLAAKLDVRFRMEHQYLVALNQRTQVIGGIFYEVGEGEDTAHLEKIVVAEAYRRAGVADALMHELFNRLQAAGYQTVTTGFFRPEYFYAYGFTIEKRYAGLVKTLHSAEEEKG